MRFVKQVLVLTLAFSLIVSSVVFGQTFTTESELVEENYLEIEAAVEEATDSKRPVDVFVKICEAVGEDMPEMALFSANNVANEMIDFAYETLKRDITTAEARTMTDALVKHVFSHLNRYSNESVAPKANAYLTSYLSKTASMALDKTNFEKKDDKIVATVKDYDLEAVLMKVESRYAWVQNQLKKQEMNTLIDGYQKMIKIQINKNSTVEFTLDENQIASIKAHDATVQLEINDSIIKLDSQMIDESSKSITVKKTQVLDSIEKTTAGELAVGDIIFDLSVTIDGVLYEKPIEVVMPLGSMNKELAIVGEYNDTSWEKLNYSINYDEVSFNAIGNHIYGLLSYESTFTDLELSQEKYVLPLIAKGHMVGMNETTFNPDGTMTRAEFTEIMIDYLDLSGEVTVNFRDVDESSKYYQSIGIAGVNSFTVASSKGNFRPFEKITREEVVALFERAHELKFNKGLSGGGSPFADQDDVSDFAKHSVIIFQDSGLVNGDKETFNPNQPITRAEVARMLYTFDVTY